MEILLPWYLLAFIIITGMVSFITWKLATIHSVKKNHELCHDKIKAAVLEGREAGRNESLQQITMKYKPYSRINEKWWSDNYECGIISQLHIYGIPVGDPIYQAQTILTKAKPEQIEQTMSLIRKEIELLAKQVSPFALNGQWGEKIKKAVHNGKIRIPQE